MKHKLLTVLLTLAAVLCLSLGLTGCTLGGKKSSSANSEQDSEQSTEQGDHVHKYTVDNVCSICGKKWEYTKGLEYTSYDGNSLVVSRIGSAGSNVVIPYGYEGKFVVAIGMIAFYGTSRLKSVTIPDSVTSIGDGAFYRCSSLTSVTIPGSVTSIGEGAFEYCSSLERIDVASDNPVYHIDGNCLIETESKTLIAGCITSTIPSDGSVTSIGEGAFMSHDTLTSITIPDSVTSIGSYAFYDCSSLESIEIPDSVTSIGIKAFYGTAYYKDQSHWDASSVLYIGNHLIVATEYMMWGSYTIRANTKTIASGAFQDCHALESVMIPDSVTSIGQQAFEYCRSLKNVTIGNGVTSIGRNVFNGCNLLESITVDENNVNYSSKDGILYNKAKTEIVYAPKAIKEAVIPDSMTEIGSSAFV